MLRHTRLHPHCTHIAPATRAHPDTPRSGSILDETRASVEAATGFVEDVVRLSDGLALLEQYADSVCVKDAAPAGGPVCAMRCFSSTVCASQ